MNRPQREHHDDEPTGVGEVDGLALHRMTSRAAAASQRHGTGQDILARRDLAVIIPGRLTNERTELIQRHESVTLSTRELLLIRWMRPQTQIRATLLPEKHQPAAQTLIDRGVIAVIDPEDGIAFRNDLTLTAMGTFAGIVTGLISRRPIVTVRSGRGKRIRLNAPEAHWWGIFEATRLRAEQHSAFGMLQIATTTFRSAADQDPDFEYLQTAYARTKQTLTFTEYLADLLAEPFRRYVFTSHGERVFHVDWR